MEQLTIMDVIDRGTTLTLAVFFIVQGAKVVERLLNTLDTLTSRCLEMHDDQSQKKTNEQGRKPD